MYWSYHIPISAPVDNHADYCNRTGWYSMILQGVVDANYWQGRIQDFGKGSDK